MVKKIIEINLLYDFYGQLLTEKQREVMHLYYEDDYSLGEIAENTGISRQAVYDTVKKSEKILREYEKKLQLVEKFKEKEQENRRVDELLDEIIEKHHKDNELKNTLLQVKKILNIND